MGDAVPGLRPGTFLGAVAITFAVGWVGVLPRPSLCHSLTLLQELSK